MAANWVGLHQDLLERISSFCIISDACVSPDYIRMLSVCKSWRSILKTRMQRELPWLMMLPNKEEEEEDPDTRVFFSLSKQKIHTIPLPEIRGKRCCGSFQNGWLMTVDLNLDICLFHPWSKKKINLPHQSTFKRPNCVNRDVYDDDDGGGGGGRFTNDMMRDREIGKVALSDDATTVVVLYGLGRLGLCRIGADNAYTHIDCAAPMDDVIYHKGHFYALGQRASLHLLHIEEGFHPHGEQLTTNLDEDARFPYPFFGYLVPDILTDTMFVITRDGLGCNTIRFDIFAVSLVEAQNNKTLNKCTKMQSLGNRVLFLGHNSPMLIRASQFPGLKGNHIYFTDSILETYCLTPYGCRDLGIFSVEDGTIELLFADRMHPMFSPPIWIATPPYSSLGDFGGDKRCCSEELQTE